jgi:UDP-N-acetylmuramyl pentapeptide phosphotransferase/UDP-N-acetylglucosamine-1-phosphate transferase
LIAGVSLWDDLRELSPKLRLVCQVVAAAIVIAPELLTPQRYFLLPTVIPLQNNLNNIKSMSIPFNEPHTYWGAVIDSINIPGGALKLALLALPFTLFWIVGMTNTVNWIDGLDGLAGGVVLIGAATLFLENIFVKRHANESFPLTSSLLALALTCAILGFLPYNWHPAKIFMGDVGAMFLGYTLAVISIIDGAKVAATLLVIGFPVLDVAWVITYRLLHGRSPFAPDRGHFHHRLLDLGLGQRQIVSIFYLICGTFGAVGIFVQDPVIKLIALVTLGLILLPLFFYAASRQTRAEIKVAKLRQTSETITPPPIDTETPTKL